VHRRPVPNSSDLARGKRGYLRGLHYWSIIWHGPKFGSNAIVGLATDKVKLQGEGYFSLLGKTSESWGWDLSKNVLRHNNETLGSYMSPEINLEVRCAVHKYSKRNFGTIFIFKYVAFSTTRLSLMSFILHG